MAGLKVLQILGELGRYQSRTAETYSLDRIGGFRSRLTFKCETSVTAQVTGKNATHQFSLRRAAEVAQPVRVCGRHEISTPSFIVKVW